MTFCIDLLKKHREELVQLLKVEENKDLVLSQKIELDKAIGWLQKIEELRWETVSRYNIVELPDMNTGFSEYRIMNDCETDDLKYWIELEPRQTVIAGDFLVISKPK